MSLTIFPQAFSVGFTPKVSPPVSQPKGVSPEPGVNAQLDVQVDLSKFDSIKIIPDETNNGGTPVSSGNSSVNHQTAFRINADSNDVVVTVTDPETGEEIRQIPDTHHQELSRRIREYQDLAFNQQEPAG